MKAKEIVRELSILLSRPVDDNGLGMETAIGFPDVGRLPALLPASGLVFDADDPEAPQATRRVGQQPSQRETLILTLYSILESELRLLDCVDVTRGLRFALTGVAVGDEVCSVRWGATRRAQIGDGTESQLQYAIGTTLTVTLYQ